jgi:hypothetical protein
MLFECDMSYLIGVPGLRLERFFALRVSQAAAVLNDRRFSVTS